LGRVFSHSSYSARTNPNVLGRAVGVRSRLGILPLFTTIRVAEDSR
jgi:hypothetical protein